MRSLLAPAVLSMERSGDSFMNATLEARGKVPPGGEHEQGECRVRSNEHPGRSAVVEQLSEPVFDEAAGVRRCAGAGTQPHLERSERTDEAEPGLRDDDAD